MYIVQGLFGQIFILINEIQSVARWLEVGFGSKLFPNEWPHNRATGSQSATM